MKAIALLLGGTLLTGCSQTINYTYSKKNFTSPTFEADLSICRRPKSPAHKTVGEQGVQPSDAMVRDCMAAKGYAIESEMR